MYNESNLNQICRKNLSKKANLTYRCAPFFKVLKRIDYIKINAVKIRI